MARKAQVRYYESRGAYYTQLHGTQHKLAVGPNDSPNGPTFTAALERHKELLEVSEAGAKGTTNTVRVLVDLYGQNLEKNGQTKSLEILLETLTPAMTVFGDVAVGALKPFHVQNWLDSRETWGPTYRRMALRTLIAGLNWAVIKGYITSQPITSKNVTVTGGKRGRGKEAYVEPANWQKLVAHVARNPWFGDLIAFMHGTGCRPAEAYNAEARYYNAASKCFVYPGDPGPDDFVWKMAKKTGKDRRVYVPDELVSMVEDRVKRFPKGPIFRTRKGGKWGQATVSVNLLTYARACGIPELTAYGLRHTFCTDWLLAGGSVKVLADLVGTSVTMIDRTYAHLEVDPGRVRGMMSAVMGGRTSAPCPVSASATSEVAAT